MITNAALDFIRSGGYGFMIPLLALSVLALAVVLERTFALGRGVLPGQSVAANLRSAAGNGDRAAMASAVAADKSLVGTIVREAAGIAGERGGPITMDRAVEHCANKHVPRLKEKLWILRAVGHIAPLLGLMGTVVGLAMAFRNIAEVGLSQQSVAKGISIALVTTITGLGIALPTLFAEYCLRAWAEQRFRAVETFLRDIVLCFDPQGSAEK